MSYIQLYFVLSSEDIFLIKFKSPYFIPQIFSQRSQFRSIKQNTVKYVFLNFLRNILIP
jgi:hypothetical protein